MSRRRYLSTKISTDPKVNALAINSGPMAALLYTWMIPHAEDDGTLTADAQELLYQVLPGQRQLSPDDVEQYVTEMVALGLVMRDNDRLVFPPEKFFRYQTYVSESRRNSAQNSAFQRTSAQNSAKQRPGEGEGKGEGKTFVEVEGQVQVQGEGERQQRPAAAGSALARGSISEGVISGFVDLYSDSLGGEASVRRAIEKCMNHVGFDRYKDKVVRLREWLDDDVEQHRKEPANGARTNGSAGHRVRPSTGPGTGSASKNGSGDTFAAQTANARRRRGEETIAAFERDHPDFDAEHGIAEPPADPGNGSADANLDPPQT